MRIARSVFCVLSIAVSALAAPGTHWVATWSAAASPPESAAQLTAQKLAFGNQTLRQIVRVSLGGRSIRIRLSNVFSGQAVTIAEAHAALRSLGSSIVAGTDRALTFSGRATIEIPAGAVAISDPVLLTVPNLSDLAISLYIPGKALAGGVHYAAQQTSYVTAGNATGAPVPGDAANSVSWEFLGGVDVLAPLSAGTVVTLGDSITDGARSTVDANKRWPSILAQRLAARGMAVVDVGIGGNCLLHDGVSAKHPQNGVSALAHFDRDVLAQPGVKYLIVLEGINDIGHPGASAPVSETPTAADLIAALMQIVERAHEAGIKVIVGTVTPFESPSNVARNYFSPEKEKVRLALNDWIRTSKAPDGVIDFERAVRDADHPNLLRKAFDSGDGLHPSDEGYTAMGEAIPLTFFR